MDVLTWFDAWEMSHHSEQPGTRMIYPEAGVWVMEQRGWYVTRKLRVGHLQKLDLDAERYAVTMSRPEFPDDNAALMLLATDLHDLEAWEIELRSRGEGWITERWHVFCAGTDDEEEVQIDLG